MFISAIFKNPIDTQIISLFGLKDLDRFWGATIVFFLPPLLLNYFLIFSRDQWKHIRKDYKSYNGRVYKLYFIFSAIVPIAIVFVTALVYKIWKFEM